MFWVYVLYNPISCRTYVGFTADLEKRLIAHNHPQNKGWTKKYQPWKLLYSEHFLSKSDAMQREKVLKSGIGREFIQSLIGKL